MHSDDDAMMLLAILALLPRWRKRQHRAGLPAENPPAIRKQTRQIMRKVARMEAKARKEQKG